MMRLIRRPDGGPDARHALAALAFLVMGAGAATAAPAPDSFSDIAKQTTPAVVNISSSRELAAGQAPQLPFQVPKGSPFEEFFKNFPPQGQHAPGGMMPQTSLGSGFVIDPEGYVVTNNHVLDGATEITVTLADGRKLPGELVGTDPATDLALVKVSSDDPLPFVEWGDSDALEVGDWVMAVGNPFGLGGTVTAGIVSARSRNINAGPFDDFLQIDAAINQGNSGGPTFGLDGKVVGVNTAIYSPNGGSVGIGFAIPSNLAKPVIAALREDGKVRRGWLGVSIQEVSPEIAEAMGLDTASGALVADVIENGPAARADLQAGDVILRFDGQPVESVRDLPRIVAGTKPGTEVAVELWRGSETRTVRVALAELKQQQAMAQGVPAPAEPTESALGATLAPVTATTRGRFGIAEDVQGVVVVEVDPSNPAYPDGLRPGDVIEKVDGKPVTRPGEVTEQVEQARSAAKDAVLVQLNRQGTTLFLGARTAA